MCGTSVRRLRCSRADFESGTARNCSSQRRSAVAWSALKPSIAVCANASVNVSGVASVITTSKTRISIVFILGGSLMDSRYYPGVEADVPALSAELRNVFDSEYEVQTFQISSTS